MRSTTVMAGGAETAPPAIRPLEARVRALADLSIAELKDAWSEAWGTPPPKGARRRLLMLGIAWKWQAEVQVQDSSSRSLERRLAALEGISLGNGTPSKSGIAASRPRPLMPGAQLIRAWKGERHEVRVTEKGYIWRGNSWASLSVIAREITGTRRNGPAFFGLREEKAQ